MPVGVRVHEFVRPAARSVEGGDNRTVDRQTIGEDLNFVDLDVVRRDSEGCGPDSQIPPNDRHVMTFRPDIDFEVNWIRGGDSFSLELKYLPVRLERELDM